MTPGSNLLNKALSVLGKQSVTYYQDAGRATNSIGFDITNYTTIPNVVGSFQPVKSTKYEFMGLDFAKSYFNFYVSRKVIDLARDVSGDQLAFQGRRYQCVSSTPWYGVDGWDCVLCVDIGNA